MDSVLQWLRRRRTSLSPQRHSNAQREQVRHSNNGEFEARKDIDMAGVLWFCRALKLEREWKNYFLTLNFFGFFILISCQS